MRDPMRAFQVLYRAEVLRVWPRFARSMLSPAVFLLLGMAGSRPSIPLLFIGVAVILPLAVMAEPLLLAEDRRSGLVLETSRLPMSGVELALVRLAACATYAILGVFLAAALVSAIPVLGIELPAETLLDPRMVIRVTPLLLLVGAILCAIAARFPLGGAIAGAILAAAAFTRIPAVREVLDDRLRVADLTDVMRLGGIVVLLALLGLAGASWFLLVRALQPRRARLTSERPAPRAG